MTADDQLQPAAERGTPATGEEAIEIVCGGVRRRHHRSEPGARRRVGGWLRRHWVAVMAAAVLGLVAAAGSVYWTIYRPDRLTDTTAQEQVLDVARAGTEALLSYSPETVDTNVADAKSRLTGDPPAALQRVRRHGGGARCQGAGVKTEANVARAAVSRMHTDSAWCWHSSTR